MAATVSLAPVEDYDPERVLTAVRAAVAALGGMGRFVRPGQRVLLKPNLLGPYPPERAVTTHPAVVRAAALLVREAGGEPAVGDSPGMGTPASALRASGLAAMMDEEGIPGADFASAARFAVPDNRVQKVLQLARAVAEADVVISLPKLKTHMQMAFTGALKNQFGCVLGGAKAQYHFRLQDRGWLAHLMIDIDRAVAPALAIVDAVIGMEGEGPSGGEPRRLGLVLAGADLAAVDAVAGDLIGLPPSAQPLLRAAAERGYGCVDLAEIETRGADPAGFRRTDWRTVDHLGDVRRLIPLPGALLRRLRRYFVPTPRIDPRRCIRCGRCRDGCPVPGSAIHPERLPGPHLDRHRCIRCYCCHEFCPAKAIVLEKPFLERRLGFVRLVDAVAKRMS